MNYFVGHVWCINDSTEYFVLELLEDRDVEAVGRASLLDTYVHIGFRKVLCNSNVLSRGSLDLLPISQYIWLSLSPSACASIGPMTLPWGTPEYMVSILAVLSY